MRTLLLALLAASAYGQRLNFQPQFPPDIVPDEVFQRRDPLKIDTRHYSLEYENERVRAIRLTLKEDEAVPMHDDVDAMAVCFRECHIRFTDPTGRIQDVHMASGETRWLWGNTHSAKNLNTHPLEMVFIELKDANKDR
jgi:hypothetical protein